MNVKIFTGLAIAALLTACGGSSGHSKEPRGTWSTGCINGFIETYVFDNDLTLIGEIYSDDGCTENQLNLTHKFNTLYDPDLTITNSGVEALKVSLTLASDIMLTLGNSDSVELHNLICPEQNWVVNQATSIMACDGLASIITPYETTLPMLLYIDGNNLYTSNIAEFVANDDVPSDVNYERLYIKQGFSYK